jgi:flavodoxin
VEEEKSMKALVVYESMFGNTEEVARAVAEGLTSHVEVELADVGESPTVPADCALVVVGGPTHAFSMTRPETRADAVRQGAAPRSTAVGIREWLATLSQGPRSARVATFDTRVERVRRLPGSAARRADRVARKLGYTRMIEPESFYARDVKGPLVTGERDRARAWGERLAAQVLGVRHAAR